jgi:hypothetical protein
MKEVKNRRIDENDQENESHFVEQEIFDDLRIDSKGTPQRTYTYELCLT